MRRNLARSGLVVLALSSVLVFPVPAEARTLSSGCAATNERLTPGQTVARQALFEYDWRAGDELIITATEAPEGPADSIELNVDGTVVDTADLSGTLTYTFESDISNISVYWQGLRDGEQYRATWYPSCVPADPTTPDDCKNGGHAAFGFKNQGECLRLLAKK